MYYSVVGLLAALVLLIVNCDTLWDKSVYEKPAWRIYRRFLFVVLMFYVTDIIWGFFEYKKLAAALSIYTTLFFVLLTAGISLWTEFTVAFLNDKSTFGRFLVYAGRAVFGIMIGLTLVNVFKPVLFTVDSSSVYVAYPLRYVAPVFLILFLTVVSVFALTSMIRAVQLGGRSLLSHFGGFGNRFGYNAFRSDMVPVPPALHCCFYAGNVYASFPGWERSEGGAQKGD